MGLNALNMVMGPPRYIYYSITAEFEVDGETVSASRIVECLREPHLFGRKLHGSGGDRYDYDVIGHTDLALPLGDGSALLIKSAHGCGSPHSELQQDDYFPEVYWIDDVEEPQFGEAYFHPSYYSQPDARVRLVSFEADHVAESLISLTWRDGYAYDIVKDIPWFQPAGRYRPTMGGYFIVVAEKEHWGQFEGAEAFVDSFDEPTLVSYSEMAAVFGNHVAGSPPEVKTGFLQPTSPYGSGCPGNSERGRNACATLSERTYAVQPVGLHQYEFSEPFEVRWPLGLMAARPVLANPPQTIIDFMGMEIAPGPETSGTPFVVDPQGERLMRFFGFGVYPEW